MHLEIAEQLARRDRFMMRRHQLMTPQQRMERMAEMQRSAWALLQASPDGMTHFMRRNFKARAIDPVRE